MSANYQWIEDEIKGRIGITAPEAELLEEFMGETHIETGTLWGGTAILAALSGADRVYSIDWMRGGWWDVGDRGIENHPKPTPGHILDNLVHFEVAHKVHLIKSKSKPFPLPLTLIVDSFLIDGGHEHEYVLNDWHFANIVAKKYIHFHDIQYEGVARVVRLARKSEHWRMVSMIERMITFERVKI